MSETFDPQEFLDRSTPKFLGEMSEIYEYMHMHGLRNAEMYQVILEYLDIQRDEIAEVPIKLIYRGNLASVPQCDLDNHDPTLSIDDIVLAYSLIEEAFGVKPREAQGADFDFGNCTITIEIETDREKLVLRHERDT